MADWTEVIVSPETPLSEAIRRVDDSGLRLALVLAEDRSLRGILTDGNIRRAILAGLGLEVPVCQVMDPEPTVVPDSWSGDDMLALMRGSSIHHLPIVDDDGRVTGLATIDELIGGVEHPNWVVLMAGGLGTRLRPLTNDRPKPLLEIDGTPILETIIRGFARQGFRRLFVSVNYRAEMIRDHFGRGERWGVQLEYLHESDRLGTVGALSLLPKKPDDPIVVMNGDLLARVNFSNLLEFHHAQKATATMAVRKYEMQVPYGVVRLEWGAPTGDRREAGP